MLLLSWEDYNKEEGDLNSVESFNFDNYSWEELPSMNEKDMVLLLLLKVFHRLQQ